MTRDLILQATRLTSWESQIVVQSLVVLQQSFLLSAMDSADQPRPHPGLVQGPRCPDGQACESDRFSPAALSPEASEEHGPNDPMRPPQYPPWATL